MITSHIINSSFCGFYLTSLVLRPSTMLKGLFITPEAEDYDYYD